MPEVRAFRTFATEKIIKPAKIERIQKLYGRWEAELEKAPPSQVLEDHGRRAVDDRDKAEVFVKTYANVSRQVRNKLQDRITKEELKSCLSEPCMPGGYRSNVCSLLTPTELNAQQHSLKCKKAPGPDDVCGELLFLGPGTGTTFFQFLNLS